MPDSNELDRIILALLFASDEPLTPKRIAQILELPKPDVTGALERLAEMLNNDRFVAVVEPVGGGYQLATRPEFSKYIARLYSGKRKQRLSKAGLETLAIIAYKQPITRAEIENIRGVSCGGVITTLLERSLIKISGKAKILGSPFLYATTQEFLEYLGLNSLKDLPDLEELEALLEKEEYREEQDGGSDQADSPPPDLTMEQDPGTAADGHAADEIDAEDPNLAVEPATASEWEEPAETFADDTEEQKTSFTGDIPAAAGQDPDNHEQTKS